DDLNCRAQAEYPSGLGGGHLTDAVTHYNRGAQAPRAQCCCCGALDCEYEWLRDTCERKLQGVIKQGFNERPTRQLHEETVNLIDAGEKRKIVQIGRAPKPNPLPAMPKKKKSPGDPAPGGGPRRKRFLSPPRHKGSQRARHILTLRTGDHD